MAEPTETGERPSVDLPISHLLRISAYWLGLTAIDSAVSLFNQDTLKYGNLISQDLYGTTLALVSIGGALVAIVIQPTVGYLSDFTVSRWGRRKPYIVFGSLLDLVFLLGIATSSTLLMLGSFIVLLQVSTNIARGPFQGYVPDLVAARQVALASALVGLMQVVGNVTGFALVAVAAASGNRALGLAGVAVVELVTMASVVLRVSNGRPARARVGRSWQAIAREAWGTDILGERSYVWLVASRLAFLTGGGILVNLVIAYLGDTFGLPEEEANSRFLVVLAIVVATNALAVVPAARASDRVGRKPIIYLSCALGAAGLAAAALAPTIEAAYAAGALFGASGGMFLAVDWALMTDIIPRASAGRYMGLSNVATGGSIPLSLVVGGVVLDVVGRFAGHEVAPRAAYVVGASLFLVSAWLLRRVVEPPRIRSALPG